jgi:hypothetical protein
LAYFAKSLIFILSSGQQEIFGNISFDDFEITRFLRVDSFLFFTIFKRFSRFSRFSGGFGICRGVAKTRKVQNVSTFVHEIGVFGQITCFCVTLCHLTTFGVNFGAFWSILAKMAKIAKNGAAGLKIV